MATIVGRLLAAAVLLVLAVGCSGPGPAEAQAQAAGPVPEAPAAREAPDTWAVQPGKAVRELGLPQTPPREGLRKAVAWYRAHGYAP